MTPVISIIIPTYNREKDLERALNSVLAQTFSDWQALVVDNHSSDNTDDLVKSFNDPRIRLLKVHNEGVIAVSRNFGLKHAEGKYIAFLDSDDWWVPEKLEVSLRYLDEGADLVYHDLFLMTKPDQKFYWRKINTRKLKSPVFEDLITNGNTVSNSSAVVRKDLLNSINGLSEDLRLIGAEDFDAWLKISKISEKLERIPQTLGYYWRGGGSAGNPNQRLTTYAAIEDLYGGSVQSGLNDKRSYWLNYFRGMDYYLLGDYKMAKKYLGLVCLCKVPFSISIRTFRYLLLIKLFHH